MITGKSNLTTRHVMLAINAECLKAYDSLLDWLEKQTLLLSHVEDYAVILHDLDIGVDHYHVVITLK